MAPKRARQDSSFSALQLLIAPSSPALRVFARLVDEAPGCRALLIIEAAPGTLPHPDALVAAWRASGAVSAAPAPPAAVDEAEGDAPGCALLRFSSARAARAVLAAPLAAMSTAGPDGAPRGLRLWLANVEAAAARDARSLQAGADAVVASHDAAEAARDAEKDALRARMLADGFTLVTRKTRIEAEEAAHEEREAAAAATSGKKKRAREGVPNLYGFQRAEDKLNKLKELRDGFAADKTRIARLRHAKGIR